MRMFYGPGEDEAEEEENEATEEIKEGAGELVD
jgi:hypothetical protein